MAKRRIVQADDDVAVDEQVQHARYIARFTDSPGFGSQDSTEAELRANAEAMLARDDVSRHKPARMILGYLDEAARLRGAR
jgi:hypothetical protein